MIFLSTRVPAMSSSSQTDLEVSKSLTQKERMFAGLTYNSEDIELCNDRTNARILSEIFNEPSNADDIRKKALQKLLNPNCLNNNYTVQQPYWTDYGYNTTIGNGVSLGPGCIVLDSAAVSIGDGSIVGAGVHFYAVTHPLDSKYRLLNEDYFEYCYPITIGKNVRIEDEVIVCPGVSIGDDSVVCADSVVTKNVPSGVIVAGNPARICNNNVNSGT